MERRVFSCGGRVSRSGTIAFAFSIWLASCGGHDVCAKYEAEFECIGLTRDQCEQDLESCNDKDRRLLDDAYGCMVEVGLFVCDTTTMTTTEAFDALQECGEELGAFIENVSDECARFGDALTTT